MSSINHPALFNNGRRTLAVLTASLASPFSCGIVFGAHDYARLHNCNIVTFPGGPPDNPDILARGRSRIFEVASKINFDAMILPLGSLSRYMDEEQKKAFLKPFRGKPIVSVGTYLDDVISVMVDNQTGMRQIVEHLIKDHGMRHIGFAGGPENHSSSQEKLQTFIDTLQAHGVEFDPRYVVHSDLNRNSADDCVKTLLDERGLKLDAIVCVNDKQALFLVKYLNERGLRVPEDIAVTGCMDMVECSLSKPRMTTIHEPMYELGWLAAKAALAALDGGDWQAHIVAPTTMVVRDSCGKDHTHTHLRSTPEPHSTVVSASVEQNLYTQIFNTLEAQSAYERNHFDEASLQRLVTQAQAASNRVELERFFALQESIIVQHMFDTSTHVWLASISLVQRYLAQKFSALADDELVGFINQHCDSMQTRLTRSALNSAAVSVEKSIEAFRELLTSLNASFDVEILRRLLVREVNITDCYINLYDNSADVTGGVKNILAISNKQLYASDAGQDEFPAMQLIPAHVAIPDEPYSLVVLPMSFRAEPIGYVAVNMFHRRGGMYETLQSLLASALKNEIQMQEVKSAQLSLLQAEKMAALGSLVAGVAHEINTPVGIILTSASVLSEEAEKFRTYVQQGSIKKTDLQHYTDTAIESARLIQSNAERAAAQITSFKLVAVDQTSEERRQFDVCHYIDEVILSLMPMVKKSNLAVAVRYSEPIMLDGYPGALAQIITNLMTNVTLHAFSPGDCGAVMIALDKTDKEIQLNFTDNGRGIQPQHIGRIFDPFFTTRRGAGGSGLGLNIVYNLVKQTLAGDIAVSSTLGEGTCFHIVIPCVSPLRAPIQIA